MMSSSVSLRQPIDNLSEDVLAEIFSYIEGDELLDWQNVCCRWHRVINTLINWKIVLERKLRSSVTWRQVKKRLDSSAAETRSDENRTDCRLLYRNIRRKIQELDHNWRSGKYCERDIDINGERIVDADDDFLLNFKDGNAVVYDRRRLQILRKMAGCENSFTLRKGLVISETVHGYKIVNVKTGNELKELVDVESINEMIVHECGLIAMVSQGRVSSTSLVQLWRETAAGFELDNETQYDGLEIRIEMDEKNMVIFATDAIMWPVPMEFVTIYFFDHCDVSTRSLGMRIGCENETALHYDQGIFFIIHRDGRIRMMDVSTGQWLRTFRHKRWKHFIDALDILYWTPIALNSKFMATRDEDEKTGDSTIFIYDLEAAKNPPADFGDVPLVTIYVPGFLFCDFQVIETEIYGIGGETTYNGHRFFKAFDFLDTGTGHEVVGSVTKRGRVVRKPTRYGQAKLHKRL